MSAIMFSEQSLAAIAKGMKTQTRRLVDLAKLRVRLPRVVRSDLPAQLEIGNEGPRKAEPGVYRVALNAQGAVYIPELNLGLKPGEFELLSPYGTGLTTLGGAPGTPRRPWVINAPGTVLWVRERWCTSKRFDHLTPKQLPARARIHYLADGPEPRWAGRVRSPRFMPRRLARSAVEVQHVQLQRLQAMSEEDAALAEGLVAEWKEIVEAVVELREGLRRQIEERITTYLDQLPKVLPFTDAGLEALTQQIGETIRERLPPPKLKVEVAQSTPEERAARVLRMAISAPVAPARPWPGPKQVLWLANGGRWVESALEAYRDWWDFLNGHRPGASWAADPWTWVVTFRPVPLPALARRRKRAA